MKIYVTNPERILLLKHINTELNSGKNHTKNRFEILFDLQDKLKLKNNKKLQPGATGGPCCRFYEDNDHDTCGKCGADFRTAEL